MAKAQIALSTRSLSPAESVPASAGRLVDAGFDAFYLHSGLRRPALEALHAFLPRGALRGLSLFAPLPPPTPAGSVPPPALASLDPDENREAAKRGQECIACAERYEMDTVVVSPATLESPSRRDVERHLERAAARPTWKIVRERRAAADSTRRQMDAYLRLLSRLLEAADRRGVRIALVPGGHPHELPDLVELRRVLREFGGAPIRVLGDTLRLARAISTAAEGADTFLEPRPPELDGVLVHDGDGGAASAHLPPGEERGEVDLEPWTACDRRLRAVDPGSTPEAMEWILDLAPGIAVEILARVTERIEGLDRSPDSPGE